MDLQIRQIVNAPVDSNCFVFYKRNSSSCIVVDPGTTDCLKLIDFFDRKQLSPEFIILTHEHFDHIAGVNKLKNLYDTKILCSEECSNNIVHRKKNLSLFYDQKGFETYPADVLLCDINYKLIWEKEEMLFFQTKGHSEGSVSVMINDFLFTGDCVIRNEKTITKLPGGSKTKLKESIDFIKNSFPGDRTTVFPGHGSPFLLGDFDINECI